jgi:hypothetical protein
MKTLILVLVLGSAGVAKATEHTSTYTKGKCEFLYHESEYSPYQLSAVYTVWNSFYSCDQTDNAGLVMVIGHRRDARGKATDTTVWSIKGISETVLDDIVKHYGAYFINASKVLANDFGNPFCIQFVAPDGTPYTSACSN